MVVKNERRRYWLIIYNTVQWMKFCFAFLLGAATGGFYKNGVLKNFAKLAGKRLC